MADNSFASELLNCFKEKTSMRSLTQKTPYFLLNSIKVIDRRNKPFELQWTAPESKKKKKSPQKAKIKTPKKLKIAISRSNINFF